MEAYSLSIRISNPFHHDSFRLKDKILATVHKISAVTPLKLKLQNCLKTEIIQAEVSSIANETENTSWLPNFNMSIFPLIRRYYLKNCYGGSVTYFQKMLKIKDT